LFANILNILQPVNGQNEYAIKALMRICLVLQEKTEPYLDPINAKLTELLSAISKVYAVLFRFQFDLFSFYLK
jgi:hypothetical protein